MNQLPKQPQLQAQTPPQKDWTGAIASLAVGQVDLKKELELLRNSLNQLGNSFMQFQQAVVQEFDKAKPAPEVKAEEPTPAKAA